MSISANRFKRFSNGLFAVDYLLAGVTFFMLLISLLFYNRLNQPIFFIGADVFFLIVLIYLVDNETLQWSSFNFWLHSWLPIISLTLLYVQATGYDHLIFSQTFDPLLQRWEALFFGHWNRFGGFPGNHLIVDELMHFFYFSYFLVLFVPGLVIYAKHPESFHPLVFTLTALMVTHFLFFILFPGDGLIARHDDIFTNGFLFIPLMKIIYDIGGDQGGGAFPSTHVAASVFIALYTHRTFKRNTWLLLFTAGGITVATVYCSYHYIIDALAGICTGTLFYLISKNRRIMKLRRYPDAPGL